MLLLKINNMFELNELSCKLLYIKTWNKRICDIVIAQLNAFTHPTNLYIYTCINNTFKQILWKEVKKKIMDFPMDPKWFCF